MRRALGLLSAAGLLWAAACSSADGGGGAAFARVDSAGVVVVTHLAPVDGPPYRIVSETPETEIGLAGGPAEYLLGDVAGAARLSDGRIVVADGQSRSLRWYGRDGRFLGAVGRDGEGPGEFRSLRLVAVTPGDSLLVSDPRLGRLTVVGPSMEIVRVASLPGARAGGAPAEPVAWWAGRGEAVLLERRLAALDEAAGVVRDTLVLAAWDLRGRPAEILEVPGPETRVRVIAGGVGRSTLPFAHAPRIAAGGGGLHVATGEEFEIRTYGEDGALARIVRLDRAPRDVSEEVVEAYRRRRLEPLPEGRRARMRELLDELVYPERLPAHGPLHVGAAGDLWVAEYDPAGAFARWDVFGPDGRRLGAVRTPEGLRVTQVGADFVLGVHTDLDGVESVRLHRLAKPAGG